MRTSIKTFTASVLAAAALLPSSPAFATDKWVTGYYAGWHWNKFDYQAPDYVDMSTMTHFVFARVMPGTGTAAGTVVQEAGHDWYDPTKGPAKKETPARTVEQYLIDKAHAAGKKALIMLGGEGANAGFEASTANATVRAQFVQNLVNYMVARGYDGIDVNWESILLSDTTNWTRLEALLSELRTAANNTPEFTAKGGIIITYPASFLNAIYDNATSHHVTVAGLVDQFNVMSYGMAWYGTDWDSTFFAPIDGHTTRRPLSIKSTVQKYVDAGIPRSKIGMGIGLYGVSYQPSITQPDQATGSSSSVVSVYDEQWNWAMLNKHGYLDTGTYFWDTTAKMGYRTYGTSGYTPPLRTTTTSGYVSYEDPSSIAAKGTWAHSTAAGEGVAGTIVWLVNFGTTNRLNNPMMVEVKKAFIDPNATAAPIPSPQLTASYEETGRWGNYYCAKLIVANAGPVTAYDWTVSLQIQGTLDGTWGEVESMTQSGSTLTVKGALKNDFNDIVPGDSYKGAGFCAY
ncbi:MAG TPA: glycosyl hydrolase family 18 protein [Myxococcaceae bacterium]